MNKKTLTVFLTCALFSFISLGVVNADSVKIGFNVPLTGFAAADGKSALNGAKLAVEQANQAGGINGKMIELVVYDDQASPKQAVPIANKLIEKDNVKAAISGSFPAPHEQQQECFKLLGYPIFLLMPFTLTSLVQEIMFSELHSWEKFREGQEQSWSEPPFNESGLFS